MNNNQMHFKKITMGFILVMLVSLCSKFTVRADYEITKNSKLKIDNTFTDNIKLLDYEYENNAYVSLRDMANALKESDKKFEVAISKNEITMEIGDVYKEIGQENELWEEENEKVNVTLRRNKLTVNGDEKKYYTLIKQMKKGTYDCYIAVIDLAMILDVSMEWKDNELLVDTRKPFEISAQELEEEGYFQGINSVLVGDATTGDIYYSFCENDAFPIASTSKLMTYLLVMDAQTKGEISLQDQVSVSKEAERLSKSGDGVITMNEGDRIFVSDLLYGLLLPSSNESALCLAMHVAGSEEVFVKRMNEKAAELGMWDTVFYNCNGLPVYSGKLVPSKLQNRMSAKDMFTLASHILKFYPQITEITSTKKKNCQSIKGELSNTNPLLYNMKEVTGLKTGTTNKSGACLVTSISTGEDANAHNLVVVMFGAESGIERTRVSELMARNALFCYKNGKTDTKQIEEKETIIPTKAEQIVERIVSRYQQNLKKNDGAK